MARILIIDDNVTLLELIALVLLAAGHTVTTAADGEIAARLFRAAPFDLILTDMIMPNGEGIETITTLRREFPAIRIIAMSGGTRRSQNYLDMAARLGAHRTLSKPFAPDELHAAIAATLAAEAMPPVQTE